jgi:hypothetical protein
MQDGPLPSTMDNAVAETPHVTSNFSNNNCVDLCVIGGIPSEKEPTNPFVHPVELKGEAGDMVKIEGLFDDGAMVNSICEKIFTLMKDALGEPATSEKALRMADGTIVPSRGRWSGEVTLGGQTANGSFEIFPSGGGWSLLFGKPLLRTFKAIHSYDDDTLKIPHNGDWTILTNKYLEPTAAENASTLKGDVESPLRQVLTSILANGEHVDKRSLLEKFVSAAETTHPVSYKPKRQGRRTRNRLKRNEDEPYHVQALPTTDNVWIVQDATLKPDDLGSLQPEVELDVDASFFTRATDPHNPRRVAEILKNVSVGADLSDEQRNRVSELLSEFADCFALSVREVLPIPGAEHRMHIPPDVTFPKKIPHQRQLTEAQRAYLSAAIDELAEADIIEPIRPEDVKCVSPITLAQKVHVKEGLSWDELRHRVNEECIANGHSPVHNVSGSTYHTPAPTDDQDITYDPTQPQKWRICQNYAALNKVTHVFPMPQGDIRTKQRRLSGHRWIHGFDFASGFYAVAIPEKYRPYLAYYVEGKGFYTPKRMPFGLTGAPTTFAHVTAEKLGDLLPKLNIELLVDDGGMAGDDFEDLLNRTRQFFIRVRESRLSLSVKKSEFFMTEIIFAGSVVGPNGVKPDATKITAVVDWRQPPDVLNLSRFLGLTGHFRDLVRGYAKIAQPLTDLVRGVNVPKNAGKAVYRTALQAVKLANIWRPTHTKAFLALKTALTSEPVLKAPRFDGTPFIVTTDGCMEGFGGMLTQKFAETRPGGKTIQKAHPIAFASKRTSVAEARYKPFLLEFAALKFSLDKFNDIIWGFPVEIETDCKALQDVLMSDTLNATHARWCDGVLAHNIVEVRHIPGRVNLVGDGISRKDEGQAHQKDDGSSWSVVPDREHAQGIHYDLFTVEAVTPTLHSSLCERFADEAVFLEVLHALLGITGASTEAERKRAKHHSDGYFVDEGKLWRLGGATPTRAVARRECVTKLEATQLAREEHAKLHMRRDHIRMQLLDKIYSPHLDASISTAILECGRCKNFGSMHVHALLAPITRRRPFELLVGDYLSMPPGKGGFTKIGLYADVFAQKLWGFKSKSAAGKNTVDSLRRIHNAFIAPETIMVDGGSHFNCNEVREFCDSIGSKLHVVAAYAPWLNGLLEGYNGILLNALKRLCAPGLGEDDYANMATKDIPSNWPEHLDTAIKHLSDRILPSLKYSPNELLLGLVVNSRCVDSPENIKPPTEQEVALHLALVEQQHLDGYAAIVDHAMKRKNIFDAKLRQRAPRNVIFQPGDLVQVHATEWVRTFAAIKKLIPMWSIPHRVKTKLLNSYTLETLTGLPLAGVYNSRRLRTFTPRTGTKLAMAELVRMETVEEEEEADGMDLDVDLV